VLLAVFALPALAQRESGSVSPQTEVWANLHGRISDVKASAHGTVWLTVTARYTGHGAGSGAPTNVSLRIPLSSTEDVYGESRSCSARRDGSLDLVFTSGMDEKNFARFASSTASQNFHLLLNKYLCRALASPFHCGSRAVTLPQDWAAWRISHDMRISADPASSANLQLGNIQLQRTTIPFDRARCAVVAPSNGLCCVAGKTTEWHCGGTPVGAGWHQVSGECFHRETGGSCRE
jgi:hypothetical protein